jgi:hypothetical protein
MAQQRQVQCRHHRGSRREQADGTTNLALVRKSITSRKVRTLE